MFWNRRRDEALAKLVKASVDQYEELMLDVYSSAATVSYFETFHLKTKSEIIEQLPTKWKEEMGSAKFSTRLTPQVTEAIDTTYTRLKRHFELRKQKDQTGGESAEMAFKHYTDQMEKYMNSLISTDLIHATLAHNKAISAALILAKSDKQVSAAAVSELKKRMDECFKEYQARIKMIDNNKSDPAIGIDLGTTMCCVVVYSYGKVTVIENRAQNSSNTTPSYVAYHEDGSATFGAVAKEEAYLYPETTIYDAKRMIGRYWTDECLQNDRKNWPFEVVNENGNPRVKIWDQKRFPHEISAKLLAHFRLMADDFLSLPQGSVRKAVVTVPAYFTEPQRRATMEAAECAGLKVLSILSEPTAAAIAYSAEQRNTGSRTALIYDLGGGTFDVAIARIESGNVDILAVDGDTHLGGQDFDQMLMDYCIEEFKKKEKVDLRYGKDSPLKTTRDKVRSPLARLRLQCEVAKQRLSTSESTRINVEHIHDSKHLTLTITKDKFEALIKPLVVRTIQIVDRALAEVKSKGIKTKKDIDDIILVGGSTRIPLVMTMLQNHFDGRQLCKSINPDEAVAYGAASQALILNSRETSKHRFVKDVTPMTLGLRNHDGKFVRLIPKNSKIPYEYTQTRVTVQDNQTTMRFMVFQGENDKVAKNKQLGEFCLEGIPARPAGEEEADITMKIDEDGLLNVHAVSLSTKRANQITISFAGLTMDTDAKEKLKREIENSIK